MSFDPVWFDPTYYAVGAILALGFLWGLSLVPYVAARLIPGETPAQRRLVSILGVIRWAFIGIAAFFSVTWMLFSRH